MIHYLCKIVLCTTLILCAHNSYASSDSNVTPDTTITFLLDDHSSYRDGMMALSQKELVINKSTNNNDSYPIPVDDLKKLVRVLKNELCTLNKGGSFEAYIKVDASSKILGIGASGEGGLKVIVSCNAPN